MTSPTLASPGTHGETPACSVHGLRKRYGGVQALRGVSIDFLPGTVHAILGENGAGKSTLMKVLAGAEIPDEGRVELWGREASYATVTDANRAGVAIVFQELSLFPELDVLANLFAHRELKRWGTIDRSRMQALAQPVLAELGLKVSGTTLVSDLALHDRQLLEIAKALLLDARVLILDEPTSSLTAVETERLFRVVRLLRGRGVAILFVSHRLEEIFAVADVVSVLREGTVVKTIAVVDTTMKQLVTDMIGRAPTELPYLATPVTGAGVRRLKVTGVSTTILREVTLDVAEGEVLGLTGLEDAGVQELMYTIFGLVRPLTGSITLPDDAPAPTSPTQAVRRGIALVPADRRKDGLMLSDSITSNLSSVQAGVTRGYGFYLSGRKLRRAALERATQLRVKYESLEDPVSSLSGGNQQKIVLGKWLQIQPSIILLDDPTRGVDVGAKVEIYAVIRSLAESGCIVVFASSELEEYEHLCQRVAVLRRGRLQQVLPRGHLDQHRLLEAMNQ